MADLGIQKVLFICLGNICRSPIAEAVFKQLVKEAGVEDKWKVDSAATAGWHIGNPPDSRAVTVLSNHHIKTGHVARQIETDDFYNYDFIIGMDPQNMKDLKKIKPENSKALLLNLAKFDPNEESINSVPDPYYDSGPESFEMCYQQCQRCCKAFYQKHKSI